MENGKWKTENGKWKMENGKWKTENGKWKMENGKYIAKIVSVYTNVDFIRIFGSGIAIFCMIKIEH